MYTKMFVMVGLDAICWAALTYFMYIAGWQLGSAIVGSFGIVYVLKCLYTVFKLSTYDQEVEDTMFDNKDE